MVVINAVNNSNLGSTLSSNPKSLTQRFGVRSDILLVLPSSVFLLGYVFGPMIAAPLSEKYGRKGVLIGSFSVYSIATLCCAVAPNFGALVFFRLVMGVGAATPLSVVGG
jgi:MFS family permease